MFYIVESESQLERLQSLGSFGAYIEVITTHDYFHPILTSIVAVYIHPLTGQDGFIIPVSHNEGLNVGKSRVYAILKSYSTLYTLNRKDLLYHFNLQGVIDISLLYSMVYFDKLEISTKVNTINWFYSKYKDSTNVNRIIPLVKLFERSHENFLQIKPLIELPLPKGFDFYNKTATNVFYLIEQHGLGLNLEMFKEVYTPANIQYSVKDDRIYSSYHLYNTTSRPTNSFNSINFSAIPKDEKHRECFRPQNNKFVELDFDGYHVRLLSNLIEYPLTGEKAHLQLAKMYYSKEEITEQEYNQAKQVNFQAIYGRIPPQYAKLEFFTKTQRYIDNLWKDFEKNGEIHAPISGKPFTDQLSDMNPQKLMNYTIQSVETARNVLILKEILRYLKDRKSKIALYIYDSIILDYSEEDGEGILEDIEGILNEGGKYPVRMKTSNSLVLN